MELLGKISRLREKIKTLKTNHADTLDRSLYTMDLLSGNPSHAHGGRVGSWTASTFSRHHRTGMVLYKGENTLILLFSFIYLIRKIRRAKKAFAQ